MLVAPKWPSGKYKLKEMSRIADTTVPCPNCAESGKGKY